MSDVTKETAVKIFQSIYADLYINRVDYWTAQQEWAIFTDRLCREDKITMKQFSNWLTPFPYGKRLRPTRFMLERKGAII